MFYIEFLLLQKIKSNSLYYCKRRISNILRCLDVILNTFVNFFSLQSYAKIKVCAKVQPVYIFPEVKSCSDCTIMDLSGFICLFLKLVLLALAKSQFLSRPVTDTSEDRIKI